MFRYPGSGFVSFVFFYVEYWDTHFIMSLEKSGSEGTKVTYDPLDPFTQKYLL